MKTRRFPISERHELSLDEIVRMSIAIHDIRNLLLVISGNIELMLLDSIPKHLHDRLVVVLDAVRSAGTLANNTLRKARQAEDSASLTSVNVSQVVRRFLTLYAATVPSNIHFDIDVPDDPLMVRAEAEQIQFVVMNLVENAVESIRRSPGFVSVRVFTNGEKAEIEVTDDGPGLLVADVGTLFEPYESFGKGLEIRGLGLSSVKESIRRMCGEIEVDSEKGESTTFTVSIPIE